MIVGGWARGARARARERESGPQPAGTQSRTALASGLLFSKRAGARVEVQHAVGVCGVLLDALDAPLDHHPLPL